MRTILPTYLIHSILLLSAGSRAISAAESDTKPVESPAAATGKPQFTLWDLGFSLQAKWSDLRELEECPVPPDLICIAGGAECGDQAVMEQVAASIRPTESFGEPGPVETPKVVEEDLVSFEDWKRRKLEEDGDEDMRDTTETNHGTSQDSQTSSSTPNAGSSAPAHLENKTNTKDNNKTRDGEGKSESFKATTKQTNEAETTAPKAHVHSKYNYASPDCSARIHSSSRLTQHASSILHKSRDRYMLTPCKADEHWVVVELCDEIRIEAVEIAVWEFFSGVVREVKVSVGGADDDDERDDRTSDPNHRWEEVGTFIGKNVRGVQTFTLPQATSFHRFVRLDFPTYFGTEYYCPVSQVKVYGMNQMEAFKSEQKRLAATAKDRDKDKIVKEQEAEERKQREKQEMEDRAREQVKYDDAKREKELDELERLVVQQARRQGSAVPEITSFPRDMPSIEVVTITASSPITTVTSSAALPSNGTVDSQTATEQNKTTTNTVLSSSSSRAAPPRSDSSESIYAHIIRRLNALEGNSSLVARYIEEQAKVMRHMLSRVEKGWDDWQVERELDELSRWEQERMRQEDRLGSVISQMEQQRLAMDAERRAVLSELRVLSDELGYERRRGIAQLLITLVIIILGVASRSSTIDAALKPLLAEARRRKSFYRPQSISGPLSGLQIDMGQGRPPAVIGHPQPLPPNQSRNQVQPAPEVPAPSSVRHHQRTNSMKRPSTPSRRRPYSGPAPFGSNMRIFSDSTPHLANIQTPPNYQQAQNVGSPFYHHNTHQGLKSPKPRVSLPPSRTINSQRKLARSAHLHTMEADRVRREIRFPDDQVNGDSTPRRLGNKADVSPFTVDEAVFSDGPAIPEDLDTRSDWDTDAGGSVSGIDDDLRMDEQSEHSPAGKVSGKWTEEPSTIEKIDRGL